MSDAEEGIDALLMDGRIVHVRPVSQRDTEALSALYTRASPRSRYLRFFSAGVSVDREVQRIVTRSDDHVALVAEHDGLALGVASYEILNGAQAEIAILVDDAWQGEGIGSLLIEHLAAVGSTSGHPRTRRRRTRQQCHHASSQRQPGSWNRPSARRRSQRGSHPYPNPA